MKLRYLFGAAILAAAGGASAQDLDIATLAKQSDLTERQVRMVLGAPTAFSEYRTTYRDSRDKLRRAVGGHEELARLAALYDAQQDAIARR